MGSVALNRSKGKDRSSRLVSGDLQWEKGGRQAPARKAPKEKRQREEKMAMAETQERAMKGRTGVCGGVRTMSPRSDVWERQPQVPGNIFWRLNEDAASASHVDLFERLGLCRHFFSEFASIPPSAKNKLQLFATQANFTTKETVMLGNLFGEKKPL